MRAAGIFASPKSCRLLYSPPPPEAARPDWREPPMVGNYFHDCFGRSPTEARQRENSREQRRGRGHRLGRRPLEPLRLRLSARPLSLRHLQRRTRQEGIAGGFCRGLPFIARVASVQAQAASAICRGRRPVRHPDFLLRRPLHWNLFLRSAALDLSLCQLLVANPVANIQRSV